MEPRRRRLGALITIAVIASLALVSIGTGAQGEGSSTMAYAVNCTSNSLVTIDMTTGTTTTVGATGVECIDSLTFSVGGTVLYGVDVVTDQLVTLNPGTGAATVVGPLGVNIAGSGLTFDCAGNLWMSTATPESLYRLDPTTGTASLIGAHGRRVTALAADQTTLYGAGTGTSVTQQFAIVDTSTGTATDIGPLGVTDVRGLDFDESGVLWGYDFAGVLFTIDPATGAATTTGNSADPTLDGLAITGPNQCPAAPVQASSALTG